MKINNENIGLTNENGEIQVDYIPNTDINIEITKKNYEKIVSTLKINNNYKDKNIVFPMVEETDYTNGSITGIFYDNDSFNGIGNLYVRLYKVRNKSDYDYDLDKDFILTTKTSNEPNLKGTFKLTNLDSGNYLLYIGKTRDIPEFKTINKVDNKVNIILDENSNGVLFISKPFKVESNLTSYICSN